MRYRHLATGRYRSVVPTGSRTLEALGYRRGTRGARA